MKKEINILKLLVANCGKFQNSNESSQRKIKVLKAVNNLLDFVIEQTSKSTIDRLVMEIYKKNRLKKLDNEL
ncbi:hypothetical protein [Nitrosopumilus sp.]|uniref:hypothetical protein n=1 Tax=Nitrosopumilus sp. TaxID=2024843 RepID=UPI003D1514FD